jgi:hypothetical protein
MSSSSLLSSSSFIIGLGTNQKTTNPGVNPRSSAIEPLFPTRYLALLSPAEANSSCLPFDLGDRQADRTFSLLVPARCKEGVPRSRLSPTGDVHDPCTRRRSSTSSGAQPPTYVAVRHGQPAATDPPFRSDVAVASAFVVRVSPRKTIRLSDRKSKAELPPLHTGGFDRFLLYARLQPPITSLYLL